jgi:hypothetical protein
MVLVESSKESNEADALAAAAEALVAEGLHHRQLVQALFLIGKVPFNNYD